MGHFECPFFFVSRERFFTRTVNLLLTVLVDVRIFWLALKFPKLTVLVQKTSQRFHNNVNVSNCTNTSTFPIFIICVRHDSVPTGRDRKLDGRETGRDGAVDGREQDVLDRNTCMATWAVGNKRVNAGMGPSDYMCSLYGKSGTAVVRAWPLIADAWPPHSTETTERGLRV